MLFQFRVIITAAGVDLWIGTPEEFDRLIKSETVRYARIAEKAGLKKE